MNATPLRGDGQSQLPLTRDEGDIKRKRRDALSLVRAQLVADERVDNDVDDGQAPAEAGASVSLDLQRHLVHLTKRSRTHFLL